MAHTHQAQQSHVIGVVRARLRAYGLANLGLDVEGAYQLAWIEMCKAINREAVCEPVAFLIRAAFCNAIDEARKRRGEQFRHFECAPSDVPSVDYDYAGELDIASRKRELRAALRRELPAREYVAVMLCITRGFRRPQVARFLGLDRQQMEKLMDAVMPKVRAIATAIANDEWCGAQISPLNAYELGLHDPDGARGRWARQHLRECPACRQRFRHRLNAEMRPAGASVTLNAA